MARPAWGIVCTSLPTQAEPVRLTSGDHGGSAASNVYWLCDGAYFREYGGGFTVVAPPVGTIVDCVPYASVRCLLDGKRFYVFDDVYFAAISQERGERYRVVVPPLRGALADLPTPHSTVMVANSLYYRVADMWFRPVFRGLVVQYVRVPGPTG